MHFECEDIDDPTVKQEHHMKKLNKFHKDAINLMKKKSTAKFGQTKTMSSLGLKKLSSSKVKRQPVGKLVSFAIAPEKIQD